MRFAVPRPRERRETIVPMINVVFLLVVFLLLTAEMAPPPPLDVEPPAAGAARAERAEAVLHVAADGTMAYGNLRGEAALAALPAGRPVEIRADADLPAALLAALLARLSGSGAITLATVPR